MATRQRNAVLEPADGTSSHLPLEAFLRRGARARSLKSFRLLICSPTTTYEYSVAD